MTTMNGATRADRRVPNSIQLAALLLLGDAIVLVAGIVQITGLANADGAGVQMFGTMYVLEAPLFPLALAPIGVLSIAAAFSAVKLRRFQFVLAVAMLWTGVAIAALIVGPGLLIERLIIVAALWRGRSAFID